MGIMKIASPLWGSRSSTAMALIVTAIAVAVILLASNFTIINAQQQQSLTSQSGEIENGRTTTTTTATFQSTNDSFNIQVPQGWVIHDANNTGSALLEEARQGYGILAQLCPEEEQQQPQQGSLPNASGSSTTSTGNSCQGSEEVVHIIRYPDLDTRIPAANNVTTASNNNNNNNMTTDDVLSYHLQKLQEVGYRSMQIVNSTDIRLNLTSPQTNETIATVPAKVVEMAYSTNSAPNEIRTGYFISTYTNATAPNPGTTKGYAVFYEDSPKTNTTSATPEITTTTATVSSSLLALTPLTPAVGQIFDSFELIAAAEVAQGIAQESQAAETTDGGDDGSNDNDDKSGSNDNDDKSGSNDNDDKSGSNDNDDKSGSNDNDGGETSSGGISSRGESHAGDDY